MINIYNSKGILLTITDIDEINSFKCSILDTIFQRIEKNKFTLSSIRYPDDISDKYSTLVNFSRGCDKAVVVYDDGSTSTIHILSDYRIMNIVSNGVYISILPSEYVKN